ncbi:MAG: hypothetical protein Q9203_007328 [Teloschistes exilis]
MVTGDLHLALSKYYEKHALWHLYIDRHGIRVFKSQDSDDRTRAPVNYFSISEKTNESSTEQFITASAYPDVELDGGKILCVPILKSKQRRALRRDELLNWFGDTERVAGLMLKPTQSQGVHMRVGVFETWKAGEAFPQKEYWYGESNRQFFLQTPEERFSDKVFAIV